MQEISPKLQELINEENTRLEQAMINARENHWQSRLVDCLGKIEALESELAELKSSLEVDEEKAE